MKEKAAETPWWPLILLILAILLSWYFWPQLIPKLTAIASSNPLTDRGLFGDSYGGLNALFSGLAFAALGYTMWMQRSELHETRAILKSQKDEAETQNSTLLKQTFDNSFFQMVRLHHEIVNTIQCSELPVGETLVGRDAIEYFVHRLIDRVWTDDGYTGPDDKNSSVLDFFSIYEQKFGHYLVNLYYLCKFVDEEASDASKTRYAKLIRAQLSQREKTLVFYHCYWMSQDHFGKLAAKLGLFEKAVENKILINEKHLDRYIEARRKLESN